MARNVLHLPSRFKAREKAKKAAISTSSSEATKARDNFAFFCEFVLDKPPAAHHQVWHEYLITNSDSTALNKIAGPNLELLAPRGSAKSTVIGAFVAWTIGHNPGIRVIYLGYSENVALSRSRLIKRIIEHPRYKQVFPWILKGQRWSDTDWEIDKAWAEVEDAGMESDYTFYAAGITGSITSRRSDLIVGDDLIKSSKAIENADVRQKILDNWSEVIEPTLVPGGRIIDIGTRFRPDDIHATEFLPEYGWQVIEQSAIETDEYGREKSYWEERFSLEELRKKRERKPVIFSFQFQNRIVRISETSIAPEWIVKGDVPCDIREYDSLCIGMDLSATKKETSDYTAFVLCGRINNKFYVLDIKRGRYPGNQDKLDSLLEMCLDWGIVEEDEKERYYSSAITVYLHSEEVAYQASLAADFKRFIVQKLGIYNLVYKAAKARGDKLSRLRGVTGIFQNLLITFNQFRKMGVLIEELTNFGSCEHDDAADALVYALQLLSARLKLDAA